MGRFTEETARSPGSAAPYATDLEQRNLARSDRAVGAKIDPKTNAWMLHNRASSGFAFPIASAHAWRLSRVSDAICRFANNLTRVSIILKA